MACPPVLTGKEFLAGTLGHIDCQAQSLGSYGYMALAQAGSPASLAMTGLLTLFVALLGLRLLFGPAPGGGDLVRDLLKVAVVLTLALSWPAWRTLVHDVTLKAPAEVADAIAPSTLPYGSGFASRLQNADTGFIALTVRGTGRNTGELTQETAPPAGFRGVALEDDTGFSTARLIFLAATIGSLAIVRLGAGLLLALTPLAAGLLLFNATRGLFSGWLKGLVLTMIGSVGITIVLAAELAILEPWLEDAIRLRDLGYATPATPTELVALTAAFGLALFGMLLLLGKVAFQRGWPTVPGLPRRGDAVPASERPIVQTDRSTSLVPAAPSRAFLVSDRVATLVRQEETARLIGSRGSSSGPGLRASSEHHAGTDNLGNAAGGRRSGTRISAAASRRDARS